MTEKQIVIELYKSAIKERDNLIATMRNHAEFSDYQNTLAEAYKEVLIKAFRMTYDQVKAII